MSTLPSDHQLYTITENELDTQMSVEGTAQVPEESTEKAEKADNVEMEEKEDRAVEKPKDWKQTSL